MLTLSPANCTSSVILFITLGSTGRYPYHPFSFGWYSTYFITELYLKLYWFLNSSIMLAMSFFSSLQSMSSFLAFPFASESACWSVSSVR